MLREEENRRDGIENEDSFTLPAAWRKQLHPRRGGVRRTVRKPAARAATDVEEQIAKERPNVEKFFDSELSAPDPVEAARAYLDGSP